MPQGTQPVTRSFIQSSKTKDNKHRCEQAQLSVFSDCTFCILRSQCPYQMPENAKNSKATPSSRPSYNKWYPPNPPPTEKAGEMQWVVGLG